MVCIKSLKLNWITGLYVFNLFQHEHIFNVDFNLRAEQNFPNSVSQHIYIFARHSSPVVSHGLQYKRDLYWNRSALGGKTKPKQPRQLKCRWGRLSSWSAIWIDICSCVCVVGSVSSCDAFLNVFLNHGLKPEVICPCATSPEAMTVALRRYDSRNHTRSPFSTQALHDLLSAQNQALCPHTRGFMVWHFHGAVTYSKNIVVLQYYPTVYETSTGVENVKKNLL